MNTYLEKEARYYENLDEYLTSKTFGVKGQQKILQKLENWNFSLTTGHQELIS